MPELTKVQKKLIDLVRTHDVVIYGVSRGDGFNHYYLEDWGEIGSKKKVNVKKKRISDEVFSSLYEEEILDLNEDRTEEKRGLTYYYFEYYHSKLDEYLAKKKDEL